MMQQNISAILTEHIIFCPFYTTLIPGQLWNLEEHIAQWIHLSNAHEIIVGKKYKM